MNQQAKDKAKDFFVYDCHKHKTPMLTKEQAKGSRKLGNLSPDPRKWFLFDASGKTLGRFASEVAKFLRGKHRADFTSHVDSGDNVLIINADKIEVTGMKLARKVYRKYTGFIGGLRETPYSTMLDRNPEFILSRAIQGMMPKSRLGHQQLKKLRVYKSAAEGHESQELRNILNTQKPTKVNL